MTIKFHMNIRHKSVKSTARVQGFICVYQQDLPEVLYSLAMVSGTTVVYVSVCELNSKVILFSREIKTSGSIVQNKDPIVSPAFIRRSECRFSLISQCLNKYGFSGSWIVPRGVHCIPILPISISALYPVREINKGIAVTSGCNNIISFGDIGWSQQGLVRILDRKDGTPAVSGMNQITGTRKISTSYQLFLARPTASLSGVFICHIGWQP